MLRRLFNFRRSTLYALPARCPLLAFMLAVSLAGAAACGAMLGCTALLIVVIDTSILAVARFVEIFPDLVSYVSRALWRAAWLASLAVCAACALLNLAMVGSLVFVLVRRFWSEELLPFYQLFCDCVEARLQQELARERRAEERVARKILERALCADVAGEISKFAGFHDVPARLRRRKKIALDLFADAY